MFRLIFVPSTFRDFSNLTKALNGTGKLNEYESTYINRLNPDIDLPDNGLTLTIDTQVDIDKDIVKDDKYAYIPTTTEGYDIYTYDGLKSIINKLNKQLDDRTIFDSNLYKLFIKKLYVKIFNVKD